MGTLTLCRADPFQSFEKSLLSAHLRYERSLYAKFQPSRPYGLGCGIIPPQSKLLYILRRLFIIMHHKIFEHRITNYIKIQLYIFYIVFNMIIFKQCIFIAKILRFQGYNFI
jgi:hypothetical protein